MGRNAGYIALNVAIASGAMAVLLPEYKFDMQRDILDRIEMTKKTGKNHFIIIVAEGVGHAQEIANEIRPAPALILVQPFWAMSSAAALPPCGTASTPLLWVTVQSA